MRFIKYTKIFYAISLAVLCVGVYAIAMGGFTPSIDFSGGSLIEYDLKKTTTTKEAEKIIKKEELDIISLQVKDRQLTLRTPAITDAKEAVLRKNFDATLKRFETVGPILGGETIRKTAVASLVAIVCILFYISYVFKKWTYGVAAVIALLHDMLVLVGVYAVLGLTVGAEIDALFVTALLTTMSFSVHDTIVVFDKVKELRRMSGANIESIADKALSETIVRSLNNSLTVVLMLIPLVFMGTTTIKFFAAALLIGTISGTYSSPCIATPLFIQLERLRNRKN